VIKRSDLFTTLRDYGGICGGLVLTAIGLDLFLVPNKIAAGGISGVATVLFHVFHFPVGGSMLIMNVFLFIVGFLILGKGFGLKTILASGLLSVFIDLFVWVLPWKQLTGDLLIAVIFGDLLTGLGMAMVFNRNASTGGTDIIARIVTHYGNINIGKALLFIDFAVAAGAGITLHSVEVAMYSLLAVIINCFSIDAFIDTFNISKSAFIISKQSDKITERAMKELGRGATFVQIEGAYTGTEMKMVFMVVRPRQTAHLREIVRDLDPEAFMTVTNVNQVLGKGFRNIFDPAVEI
jgi:uncharacterized membrane-anchored protein YitT (DUF2179 family)